MMTAIKYFLLDNKLNKMRHIIWLVVLCNAWFLFKINIVLMRIIFMTAMAMILQGTNFLYEQKSCVGFTNMLPGNDKDRVIGRYLSGIVYLIIATFIQIVFLIINNLKEMNQIVMDVNLIIIGLGCGLILMVIYSNLLYLSSGGNNNVKSTLFLLPLVSIWATMPITTYELKVVDGGGNVFVNYVKDNITMVTLIIFTMGILVYLTGIYVSVKVVQNKDFV